MGIGVKPSDVLKGDVLFTPPGQGSGRRLRNGRDENAMGSCILSAFPGSEDNVQRDWVAAARETGRRATEERKWRQQVDRALGPSLGLGPNSALGSANINIDVKAPRNTNVDADADGIFKQTTITRTPQMPVPGGNGSGDWSSYIQE